MISYDGPGPSFFWNSSKEFEVTEMLKTEMPNLKSIYLRKGQRILQKEYKTLKKLKQSKPSYQPPKLTVLGEQLLGLREWDDKDVVQQ